MEIVLGNVLSLLLGAGITLTVWRIQSKQSREWQLEDYGRQQKALRDQEVRARADVKAQEALTAIDDLERLLVHRIRLDGGLWPLDPEQNHDARDALRRFADAAVFLQEPLRRHLELGIRVLKDADRLGQERWHGDSGWQIGRVVLDRCRSNVGRYLRNERVPEGLSTKEEEYEEALARLDEYIEHQIEVMADEGDLDGSAARPDGQPH